MRGIETPYNSAYVISAGPNKRGEKTGEKLYPDKPAFQVAEIFNPLWEARKFARPRAGDTLERFSARLNGFKYLGSFYRGQIIADLKYVEPLRSASDWMTFAEPGPGSKPGLNLVLGRPAHAPWTDNEWRGELRSVARGDRARSRTSRPCRSAYAGSAKLLLRNFQISQRPLRRAVDTAQLYRPTKQQKAA